MSSTSPPASASASAPSADPGGFVMRWTKHNAVLVNILREAFRDGTNCDLMIRCAGHTFPVHKVVVCAFSRRLREICEARPEAKTLSVEEEACGGPGILRALFEFIYVGEVTVDEADVERLLKAAKKLKIIGLVSEESLREQEEAERRARVRIYLCNE